jgi:hypothetical protein
VADARVADARVAAAKDVIPAVRKCATAARAAKVAAVWKVATEDARVTVRNSAAATGMDFAATRLAVRTNRAVLIKAADRTMAQLATISAIAPLKVPRASTLTVTGRAVVIAQSAVVNDAAVVDAVEAVAVEAVEATATEVKVAARAPRRMEKVRADSAAGQRATVGLRTRSDPSADQVARKDRMVRLAHLGLAHLGRPHPKLAGPGRLAHRAQSHQDRLDLLNRRGRMLRTPHRRRRATGPIARMTTVSLPL